MYNKKDFKEIKQKVEEISLTCESFEENENALKLFFTEITDGASPRKDEFNKRYNIIEIAHSKSKNGLIHKYKDGTVLNVEYIFYDKAPLGIIVFLNQMRRLEKGWFQCGISAFIKEN